MKQLNKILFLALAGTLIISSCKKEDKTGPQVIASTATITTWAYDAANAYYYASISVGALTADIVNYGAVNVYLEAGSGQWVPLPRTVFPSSTYSQSQRFVFGAGSVSIIVQDSDLTQPAPLGTWTVKIVCVEGFTKAQHPDLNWSDYNEVKSTFNLPE